MSRPSGISWLEQLQPVKTAQISPASQTAGVKVLANPMHLDEIPVAMDRMGWKVSAQLMRRWFAGRPDWRMSELLRKGQPEGETFLDYTKLPASQIEDQIIKIKWMLGFESVVPAYEATLEACYSEKGVGRLKQYLAAAGWSHGHDVRLGVGLKSAIELDGRADVNYRKFGESTDILDDLYGSIFRGVFKVALVGKTAYSWKTRSSVFEIEKMGIYLRDTYEFNAPWYEDLMTGLGVWGRSRMLSKWETLDYKTSSYAAIALKYPGFVPVRNSDFYRWQSEKGSGADFFVFSDVHWVTPPRDYVSI